MLQKNQLIEADCTGLGADFEGICRHDGQVVFVRGALPGERVRVRVIKATKSYAVGRLEGWLSTSPERAAPPCPYYPRCGGCTAQHMAYGATLRHKRQQVADCLERIGGFAAPEVAEAVGMDDPWRYRNKGAFPVGGMSGAPAIGIYAARSHDIVDAPDGCLLQSKQSDALVAAVRRWMAETGCPPYDEAAHRGLIRHVMTREAADGSAMLILAVNGRGIPAAERLVRIATEAVPSLASIVLSENTRRTNVILGDAARTLWGADALEDTMDGLRLRVSPRSFFQVNRAQAARLYALAIDACGLTGAERVWDVYCGAGSITLPLARRAAHVTGIEVVEDAVADARANAERNGIGNVAFVCGAAEAVLPGMARAEGAPDVIVVDPPRKGCDPAVLETIARVAPKRIVYVSCNPATLARDAALLAGHGYALGRVTPVDMFCWTGHVECVALMMKGQA